jgi:hypothetical protein
VDYPYRSGSVNIRALAFKNNLQYAYNVSYISMGLTVSGRLSVPAIPREDIRGIIIMLRGHQNTAGYYTGKGTEYPARAYLREGWAVIARRFGTKSRPQRSAANRELPKSIPACG